MTAVLGSVVPVVAASAVLLAVLVLGTTRRIDVALPVLLDLLLVAGLLRLTASTTWAAIASAALVVLIREVATLGITAARQARETPT